MDLRQRQVVRLSELLGFQASGDQIRSAFYVLAATERGRYLPNPKPRNAEEAAKWKAEDKAHTKFVNNQAGPLSRWLSECMGVSP